MKTKNYLLCLLTLLFGLSVAYAGDKEKPKKAAKPAPAKKVVATNQIEKPVLLTGSYLKQPIRQAGRLNDAPYQVVVIDRDAIQRSGARDLRQLLAKSNVGR